MFVLPYIYKFINNIQKDNKKVKSLLLVCVHMRVCWRGRIGTKWVRTAFYSIPFCTFCCLS